MMNGEDESTNRTANPDISGVGGLSEETYARTNKILDNSAKSILRLKIICAWILKTFVPEYKNCSVRQVFRCIASALQITPSKPSSASPNVSAASSQTPAQNPSPALSGASAQNPSPASSETTDDNAAEFNPEDDEDVALETPEVDPPSGLDALSQIRRNDTEDTIAGKEKAIHYDIFFYAKLPDSDEQIGLLINIESQMSYPSEYNILQRAIYYCARLISQQKGTIFENDHYGKMRKVYSLWICKNVPEPMKNTVNFYKLNEQHFIGNYEVPPKFYDYIFIGIIGLGDLDAHKQTDALTLLNTIFASKIPPDKKLAILANRFNIKSTKVNREVKTMFNEAREIYNGGYALGERKGFSLGRDEGISLGRDEGKSSMIRIAIKKNGWTPEQAFDFFEIPADSRDKYEDLLK